MKKRILSAALVLVLCLAFLPAAGLAADTESIPEPPEITGMTVTQELGAAWIELTVYITTRIRNRISTTSSFGDEYISGLEMNVSVDGGAWQQLSMTPINESSKWNGAWRSPAIGGLAGTSWVQARIRFVGNGKDGSKIYSDWSEAMSINEGFEFNAHDWAKAELKEADKCGLIPADLREKDLKEPITRAEFAAVSVKVYEALSGVKAEPAAVNPFTDTKNPEVLKALNVGITNGLSDTEFGPAKLLNREQAATMLSRVYKKVAFAGWTLDTDGDYAEAFRALFTMPEPFADDADISSWAKDSVYFMAANGVLNGVGNNCFAPKLVTSGEETLNHATREQAILIAVRLVQNLSA